MTIENNDSPLTQSEVAELKRLIAASADRGLLPQESERLEKLLAASREARSIYIGYMQLDAGLDWTIRGSQSLDLAVERLRSTTPLLTSPDPIEPPAAPVRRRIRLLSIVALAASLLLVVASVAWLATGRPRNYKDVAEGAKSKDQVRPSADLASDRVVANVVQLSKECRWFLENRRSEDGGVRAGDSIRLTRGQLRMDFTCGATLTMRSPAALEVVSAKCTRAVLGTLKAHVGKGAEGFTVETPRTTVVDLGTDFGVDVSRHGSTDVVVFNGMVDLHSDGIHGLNSRQRLSAGQGVRVSGEGTASRIVSILDSQFSMGESRRGRDRTPVITEVRDNIRRGQSWNYYEIVHGGMREDAKAFVDREHEWNGLTPGGIPRYLLGADYVKTFNDDKLNRAVEIRVTISRPSILYVLLDKRSPVPDWLRSRFFNTGDEIGLDGGKYSRFGERKFVDVGPGKSIDDVFSVWRLDVPAADTVTLGAIQAGGETHNMYGIAAVPTAIHQTRDDYAGSASHPTQNSARLSSDLRSNATPGDSLSADGEIERPNDADVFRFDWKGGVAEVACQTSGFTTLDPVLYVYDAKETLVGYVRAPRLERERTSVRMNLLAGTYWVVVTGSDDVGEVGPYHLEVTSASADCKPPLPASSALALKSAPGKNGVELSWNDMPNWKSYVVEASTDAVNFQAVHTTTSTHLEAALAPGQIRIYRVRSDAPGGPASAPLLTSAAPAAVTRLQAFGTSSRSVALEWRDAVRDKGYRVERSTNGGPFATIGKALPNACGYHDRDVAPGSRYVYRVATIASNGPEAISGSVSALTGAADVSAIALGNAGVAVSWKADYRDARFFIERSVGGRDSFVTIGAVNGDAREFIDHTALAGEEPRYRVLSLEDVSELKEEKTDTSDFVRLPDWVADEHFFALRFTGKIEIPKRDKYNFYLTSDDGSRLFIDGSLVVNNDERHVEQKVCGTIELEAGKHDLEVQYFEHDGYKKLELLWAGAGSYGEVPRQALSSVVVRYYKGAWPRLPFSHACAVSDVVQVAKPVVATEASN